MHQYRKIVTTAASVVLIAAAIVCLAQTHVQVERHGYRFDMTPYILYFITGSLLVFLIAALSAKNWFEYFANGHVAVNPRLLIPGIVLFIYAMIPSVYWIMYWAALPVNWFKTIFYSPLTPRAIAAVSGILIARAFTTKVASSVGDKTDSD